MDPLPYFRSTADPDYWSNLWAAQSLENLLAVANVSPLTRFLERFLRPGMRALEGGCGLGQYVLYFSRKGVSISGIDYSSDAVSTHLSLYPDSDIHHGELEQLRFGDQSFDAYLSIGVIEHYEDRGTRILTEARRVLAEDGLVLLSTPYLNASRRLLRRRIERQQRMVSEAGGTFYQFAFDESTLDGILRAAGFEPVARAYYDAGRGLRDLSELLIAPPPRAAANRSGFSPRSYRARPRIVRAVMRSRPSLWLFAHMQIVCARKIRDQ